MQASIAGPRVEPTAACGGHQQASLRLGLSAQQLCLPSADPAPFCGAPAQSQSWSPTEEATAHPFRSVVSCGTHSRPPAGPAFLTDPLQPSGKLRTPLPWSHLSAASSERPIQGRQDPLNEGSTRVWQPCGGVPAQVTARRDVWRECSRRPSECHAGLGSQRRTAAPCAPETRRVRTKGADRGWRQLLPRGRGQRFRFAAAPSVHSAPLPRAHRRSRGAGRVAPRAAGEGARSRVGGQGSRRGAGRKGGLPGSGGRPGSGEAELGARVVGGARDAASPGTWRASRVHADCWVARALAAAPYGALEG
ncbi:unnamed protein product [Rangifer tarandus platyrhynchus]|uniref:Uncharacterized protein n=1 Tax=Rangifer tarandus platyrhynchus TaxID=3082113 RepID=A0AC59YF86_RANTA